jgi:aerobic carbon-monoxide dehydrogenase large subunit
VTASFEAGRFGSGQVVRRVEDPALVAGQGQFTDDVSPAGTVHLAFLRSPYAHARIAAIDCAAARQMPGVLAVFTGADLVRAGVKPIPNLAGFKRPDGTGLATAERRALAHERVRFAGEAVAAVVAESRDAARAGADAVIVDYDELQAVVDPLEAMRPGAPVLCDRAPDNISAEARHGDAAAATHAFESAAHRVALDLVNQRLAPWPAPCRRAA